MEANSSNISISEQYRKYLIELISEDASYYVVWGTDMSDKEQPDNLLIDEHNRLLVFSSIEQIKHYIAQPSAPLFDEENTRRWGATITTEEELTVYDLDRYAAVLTSRLSSMQVLNNPDDSRDLLDIMHLISDYANQINDEELLDWYWEDNMRVFSDYIYDSFFWTVPPDELKQRQARYLADFNFDAFKNAAMTLLNLFKSRFHFVQPQFVNRQTT